MSACTCVCVSVSAHVSIFVWGSVHVLCACLCVLCAHVYVFYGKLERPKGRGQMPGVWGKALQNIFPNPEGADLVKIQASFQYRTLTPFSCPSRGNVREILTQSTVLLSR